jgi:hypothetical protein
MKDKTDRVASKGTGLAVNGEKTKYVLTCREQNEGEMIA